MKVVITSEDTIRFEEQKAVDRVLDLIPKRGLASEEIERAIRRMAANIIESQLWRMT